MSSRSAGSTRSAGLLYVAITRAEDTLLLSGHQWGSTELQAPRAVGLPARGPRDHRGLRGHRGSRAVRWTSGRLIRPTVNRIHCGTTSSRASGPPPRRPDHRRALHRGAGLVAAAGAALTAEPQTVAGPDPHGWAAEVDALLAERAAAPRIVSGPRCRPSCRSAASSSWAATGRPPCRGCTGGCRLVPTHTRCWAPLFTTGCNGSTAPSGSSTSTTCPAPSTGMWAGRTPRNSPSCRPRSWRRRGPRGHRSTSRCPSRWSIGAHIVRGRIDAVFADADGGVTVVDWKTGAAPSGADARRHAAVQLGVYRLAWAALHGCPESVGAGGLPLRAQRPHRHSRRAAGPRRTRRPAAAARMRVTARRRA